jgi:hypothetical protein
MNKKSALGVLSITAMFFSLTFASLASAKMSVRDLIFSNIGSSIFDISATQASNTLVISQVYGGGGGSGATYQNDYVEIFNISSSPQSLNGLSIQYGSSSGNFASTTGNLFVLPNITLQPGQRYLFGGNSTAAVGATTPAPDNTPQTTFNMSGTAGKVALVNGTTSLACGGATACTAAQLAQIVDAVAYGAQTGTYTGEGGT